MHRDMSDGSRMKTSSDPLGSGSSEHRTWCWKGRPRSSWKGVRSTMCAWSLKETPPMRMGMFSAQPKVQLVALLAPSISIWRLGLMWALSSCARSLLQAVLAPPSLSYKPITSAPRDRGNISHDPTRDSSRDPFATCTSRDLSACDPGNLRPHDPGKITYDLSRNWSSTMSHDKMRFGRASNPLINTWQIMGTINKTRPLNNQ